MENLKELKRHHEILNSELDSFFDFNEFIDFLMSQNLIKNFSLQKQYLFTFHYLKKNRNDLKNVKSFCKEINRIFKEPVEFKPLILTKLVNLTFVCLKEEVEYESGLFSLKEEINKKYNIEL